MAKRQPIIVEMTGIFGAGFLPGLFKPVTSLLQDNYNWLDGGSVRNLIANYHVDNEAAKKSGPSRREQITELIRKAPNLSSNEWEELVASLKWADDLFQKNPKRYPCNVCFRRGGRL
jgi:hypothetical protein